MPFGAASVAPAILDLVALAAGVGVGIALLLVPYVLDQLAMARLPRATYSLMVSLLPATVTVIGIVVLAQSPLDRGARVNSSSLRSHSTAGRGRGKASGRPRGPSSSMLLRFPRPARASPVRALPRFPYPFVSR